MKMTTIGVDLAKNQIQVHGVNERGKVSLFIFSCMYTR